MRVDEAEGSTMRGDLPHFNLSPFRKLTVCPDFLTGFPPSLRMVGNLTKNVQIVYDKLKRLNSIA